MVTALASNEIRSLIYSTFPQLKFSFYLERDQLLVLQIPPSSREALSEDHPL
jgi:hypothetical protein